MTTQEPEALRLAEHLEKFRSFPDDIAAAAELRRLHARVQELEAEIAEQYRIIGMSSERELHLLARIDDLEASQARPRHHTGEAGMNYITFSYDNTRSKGLGWALIIVSVLAFYLGSIGSAQE